MTDTSEYAEQLVLFPEEVTSPTSPRDNTDKVAPSPTPTTTAVSRTNSVIMGLSVLNVRKILQHMRAKWDSQVKNHEPFYPTEAIPMGLVGDQAWTAQEFALLFLQGHHAKRSQKRATQRARARPSMETTAVSAV